MPLGDQRAHRRVAVLVLGEREQRQHAATIAEARSSGGRGGGVARHPSASRQRGPQAREARRRSRRATPRRPRCGTSRCPRAGRTPGTAPRRSPARVSSSCRVASLRLARDRHPHRQVDRPLRRDRLDRVAVRAHRREPGRQPIEPLLDARRASRRGRRSTRGVVVEQRRHRHLLRPRRPGARRGPGCPPSAAAPPAASPPSRRAARWRRSSSTPRRG